MDEIKKLKKKIKEDEKSLKTNLAKKFKKTKDNFKLEKEKTSKRELWKLIKAQIKRYESWCNAHHKILKMTGLARILGVSDKTAKKYYELYAGGKNLEYYFKSSRPHNSKLELKHKIIDAIARSIERTDKHLGEKVLLTLRDLVEDAMIDLKITNPPAYSTIHSWIRNIHWIDYKYASRRRRIILKRVQIIKERLEENKIKLWALRKAMALKSKEKLIIELTNTISKEIEEKEQDKNKLSKPGVFVQWDGSQDTIFKNVKANRLQVVDTTGYLYSMRYTKSETNKAYRIALSELLKVTRPSFIMCDRRKGVDPADHGALIAGICKNLGITILASSNPNHKALVEKNHGLLRSLASLHFSRQKVKSIKRADQDSAKICKKFNERHKYKKPNYNGKRVSNEIIEFIQTDGIQLVKPENSSFIVFEKNAYELLNSEGSKIKIDLNDVYVVGRLKEAVMVLHRNSLYRAIKVPEMDLTTKALLSNVFRTNLKNKEIIVMNPQSMEAWIRSQTAAIYKIAAKDVKEKYQAKMEELFLENQNLLKDLNKKVGKR